MKKTGQFVASTLLAGFLVITPIYLAGLLVLKAMNSLMTVVRPAVNLVPAWLPAEHLLSFLLVLLICFLVGLALRTAAGKNLWERLETGLCYRIPGYRTVRSFIRRLSGEANDSVWQPVLVQTDEALVPGFIIEELADGRFTVFVPSAPTPLAGGIFVYAANRIHFLDVSFAEAMQVVVRWGSGTKNLIAAMQSRERR